MKNIRVALSTLRVAVAERTSLRTEILEKMLALQPNAVIIDAQSNLPVALVECTAETMHKLKQLFPKATIEQEVIFPAPTQPKPKF